MSNSNRFVSRRAVLGGAVAAGMGLTAAPAAHAGEASTPGQVDREAVDAVASRLDADLIGLRRDIHRHPETSGQERRTAALVAGRLRAAGLDVAVGIGGHGVVGVLTGARPGRTVAYRADMDAVPRGEQLGGGSEAAHLCGHDVHTAVGVGIAEVLARLRDRLAGTVLFVFQPAEETLTGAAAMLDDGFLRRHRPAEIHALHCGPFPVGQFAVTPGSGLPGQDRGVITLTGANAAARAGRLAARLSTLGTVSAPATAADLERLVTDLQTSGGPLSTFVFMQAHPVHRPGRAEVRIAYRCWPRDRHLDVRRDIDRLARSAGAAVAFPNAPSPAMLCPEREGLEIERHLRRVVGHDRVRRLHAAIPFCGDDFARFLNQLPGTFTFLGVRTPGAAIETSYPHLGTFAPDERAIGHGVRAMAGWLAGRTGA